ncbi:hypothetical protein APY04_3227 [Hyphomicrobium sulfonivorans]|uniref:Outer membrane lipoprotein-sorting protein n=1 Tax=Hyphomicrobium sulfonivorans TaxID=121290 RepID=A0A120CTF5_HYPSL|nr:hypothetical protein [Hyphomicrobium sulfonivorans]KWT64559.1 hypothetical protein APY04_3227 [Hyphomicrobium sulfonivorans]
MEKQNMVRVVTALALMMLAAPLAHAACKDEVATALDRQRNSSGFRMETKMFTEDGLVDMTVDYVLPNRLRQHVTSSTEPRPVETIVIGNDGWTRMDGGNWEVLDKEIAVAMAEQMQETLKDLEKDKMGDYECLGRKTVSGKNYLAYQAENPDQLPIAGEAKAADRPVRVIYVDSITGLPMRSVFTRANALENPFFQANYSYPVDLKVQQPEVKAAADAPAAAAAPVEKPAEQK